jgi:hypothetical protein
MERLERGFHASMSANSAVTYVRLSCNVPQRESIVLALGVQVMSYLMASIEYVEWPMRAKQALRWGKS